MVEVFKTNVNDKALAQKLARQIQQRLSDHMANFDLEDCDNILRVECSKGEVQAQLLLDLLQSSGVRAEVLPD